jgi:hypothetical protein
LHYALLSFQDLMSPFSEHAIDQKKRIVSKKKCAACCQSRSSEEGWDGIARKHDRAIQAIYQAMRSRNERGHQDMRTEDDGGRRKAIRYPRNIKID